MSRKVVIPSLIVIFVLLLLMIGKLNSSDYPRIPIPNGYLGMTKEKLFENIPNLEDYDELLDGEGYITTDRRFAYIIGEGDLSNRVNQLIVFTKKDEYEGIKVGMNHEEAEKIIYSRGFIMKGDDNTQFNNGEIFLKYHWNRKNIIEKIIIALEQKPIIYPRIPIPGGHLGMNKEQLFENVPNLERYREVMNGEGYMTSDWSIVYIIGEGDLSNRVKELVISTKIFEYEGIKVGMSADEADKILTSKGFIRIDKDRFYYTNGEVNIEFLLYSTTAIEEIVIALKQEEINY
jgi:hypothetical protein